MADQEEGGADSARGTNIVLVGFMATGKTSVGTELARLIGYEFVDTDELVVRQAGKSISRIFEGEGEEAFRDLESEVLRGLGGRKGSVISTGGGILGREENRPLLSALGFVVWLTASDEELLRRAARSQGRPLLAAEDPAEQIRVLLAERECLYHDVADLTIDSTDLSVGDVAYGIAESARVYFAGNR